MRLPKAISLLLMASAFSSTPLARGRALAPSATTTIAPFAPANFQADDGALLMEPQGNNVDPYFAMKSLIVAADSGLDISAPAEAWIRWLLPRQRTDGRFDRYCRSNNSSPWRVCAVADADDSMMALWLELLYRESPGTMPAKWQASAAKAQQQLDGLRNSRLGVYHVSRRNHVALFMDNVEVFSALHEMSQAQARMHDPRASATGHQAEGLAHAIQNIFWDGKYHYFRPSIQKQRPAFYPDVVGQTYAWMASLPLPEGNAEAAWKQWKQRYSAAWLSNRFDPHPWGLVAVTALKLGDNASAICWLTHAEAARFGPQWNILEEASFQTVEAHETADGAAPGADAQANCSAAGGAQ